MQNLVIIGANEFQLPLIQKARECGYTTHVFAWEDGAVGKTAADFFYPISITEKEQILAQIRALSSPPCGVVSVGSDLAVPTVTWLSAQLNLCANTYPSSVWCTNKYAMRKRLQEHQIPCPAFQRGAVFEDIDWEALRFPIVIKPTDRSGSRGICKIDRFDPDAIRVAFDTATDASLEHAAIAEEFIAGNEYSCESISFEGVHTLLAFTEKFTTGAPHFIETGHQQPAVLSPTVQARLETLIPAALTALDIRYGAAHTEFKVDADGIIGIIEIGARMGGDYIGSDLTPLSTGFDFLKMVIDTACGNPPDFTRGTVHKTVRVDFVLDETVTHSANRLGHTITWT